MMAAPIGTRSMRLSVDGLAYSVTVAGEAGPPLLLLHGFTGSGATWLPLLASLAAHHRVMAVDLPGHGRTDAPEDPTRYSIDRTVDDLLVLMDQMEEPLDRWSGLEGWGTVASPAPVRGNRADPWAVLGYSMGGRLALHLALAAPERVAALVLEERLARHRRPGGAQRRREADEALAARIERDGIAAFVERWEALPLFASQRRLPVRRGRAAGRSGCANDACTAWPTACVALGAGTQEALHERLATLPMPVLLIAGELDEKYRELAGEMAGRMPHAQVAIVADAGQQSHLEQPAAIRGER